MGIIYSKTDTRKELTACLYYKIQSEIVGTYTRAPIIYVIQHTYVYQIII